MVRPTCLDRTAAIVEGSKCFRCSERCSWNQGSPLVPNGMLKIAKEGCRRDWGAAASLERSSRQLPNVGSSKSCLVGLRRAFSTEQRFIRLIAQHDAFATCLWCPPGASALCGDEVSGVFCSRLHLINNGAARTTTWL